MPATIDQQNTRRLHAETARAVVSEVFLHAGCKLEEAARIASRLVDADLRGHPSHGIARTARYVQWIDDGILRPNQDVAIEYENEVLAILNGNYGFGQSVGETAVDIGISKARTHGVSMVTLKNSGHLGCISDWAARAAEANMASIHFVNVRGSLLVAPFGGKEARSGTSPICCGIPGPDDKPIILDFATSKVAEGKALVALRGGAELGDDAFISSDGQFSGNPELLYGDNGGGLYPRPGTGKGVLTAFGLHKGSGLNFFAEIFAGALTGSGAAGGIGETERRKLCNGMLSFFVDISQVDKTGGFAREVRSFVDFFKSSAPIDEREEVLVPGEKEERLKAILLEEGIPISGGIWSDILKTAEHVRVPRERLTEIVGMELGAAYQPEVGTR